MLRLVFLYFIIVTAKYYVTAKYSQGVLPVNTLILKALWCASLVKTEFL